MHTVNPLPCIKGNMEFCLVLIALGSLQIAIISANDVNFKVKGNVAAEGLGKFFKETKQTKSIAVDIKEMLRGMCVYGDMKKTITDFRKDVKDVSNAMHSYKKIGEAAKQISKSMGLCQQTSNRVKQLEINMKSMQNDMTAAKQNTQTIINMLKKRPTTKARDCTDIRKTTKSSGIYWIKPTGYASFKAYCDMTTDGGGWTVFQRRMDGSTNFYRKWAEYKSGFGTLSREFWLGNDHIHAITKQGKYEMRIDLHGWKGSKWYVLYKQFNVGNEKSKYMITVGGYSGTGKNNLKYHNNMKFSTYDHDNDADGRHCAKKASGAWWYKSCHMSNLNGLYKKGKSSHWNVVSWRGATEGKSGHDVYSLKFTRLMIRRKY